MRHGLLPIGATVICLILRIGFADADNPGAEPAYRYDPASDTLDGPQ